MQHPQRPLPLLLGLTLFACGGNGSVGLLPLVSPSVRAAAPAALFGDGRALTLEANDLRTRFFTEGPTSIWRILAAVDSRITEINARAARTPEAPCLHQTPAPYTISPWGWGQKITMFAQCFATIASNNPDDPAFIQWGVLDGVVYLLVQSGDGPFAAILTPMEAPATGFYEVHLWSSVGVLGATPSTFDRRSYAAIELRAHVMASAMGAATQPFEVAVAGIGVGYCGVQLASNGGSIYAKGSADLGATCGEVAEQCVLGSDLSAPGTCDGALQSFRLPAIGRRAASGSHESGASLYPSMPNVVLDGSGEDGLSFAPRRPSPGASKL